MNLKKNRKKVVKAMIGNYSQKQFFDFEREKKKM